jgi:hypothetical protein
MKQIHVDGVDLPEVVGLSAIFDGSAELLLNTDATNPWMRCTLNHLFADWQVMLSMEAE